MQGTVTTTVRDPVTIHTYTSPESGLEANTHVIELATQLLVLDTQYAKPFAQEAVAYAAGLGKPVTRVYVSHDHPDHFFGAALFGAPVYALAQTRDAIAAAGQQMLANNQAALGDFIPDEVAVPSQVVELGTETIDGVRFEFRAITDTEAAAMLLIALPEHSVLLAQDLVYDNLHLYLVDGHLDSWRRNIETLQAEQWTTVLPGHGAPGGPEQFDFVLNYLAGAAPVLATATTGDELKGALIAAFPQAGGTALLDIQNRYLFPPQ
jgi:glyoxylase-like metal-dependent hydrolase (beta-lactamase superfamily II)